jgi:hypothetical protein
MYLLKPKNQSSDDLSNTLIVESGLLTLDGGACDKIGVGYKAFSAQANQCKLHSQSCLAN